jgi:hypothetical protein
MAALIDDICRVCREPLTQAMREQIELAIAKKKVKRV